MAKKQNFELSDFSFDKSLDVPDFNFDLKPPKDNRKPIQKVASGLKQGITSSAMSGEFVHALVKNALPPGFGSAYDLVEKSGSTLKSLYDDTTKEIRPFMNDLKRTTARLLPKVDEVMPKALSKKVKEWTDTADQNPTSKTYNPREAEIGEMLAGMATAQAQLQQKTNADNDVKDRLREGLEQVRHRDRLKQGDALRLGIAQLTDYQNNVTANYHRKSLELQYRHYFVAMDALEEAKRSNAENKAALAAIVHNTSLPEQVKLTASDSFKQMAKRQAMSMAGNALFGRTNEFINSLRGNVSKTATGRVKNLFGTGRGVLSELNGALDGADMAEAMGMRTDPHHMAGLAAGSLGTSILGGWLAKKLKPHLDKAPGVKSIGNKLQYGTENIPQLLNEWARSNKHEGGVADGLVRFLKANVRMSSRMSTGLQKDTVASMNEPSFFSRHASKSLTEIIPGYLARMLRELQIIRTGDTKTELVHYDHTKNKLDTRSNVHKNAFDSLVKGKEREWTTGDVDSLLDQVDPKKTLNPEQRKALGQQLLRNNVRGRLGSVDVLGKSGKYDGTAAPHSQVFAKLMQDHFKNDPDNEKKHAFANKYNNLGAYASASREHIQHFANLGMTDFLDEHNLLHPDGDKANLEQFFEHFYNPTGGTASTDATGTTTGTAESLGKTRRTKKRSGWAGKPGIGLRDRIVGTADQARAGLDAAKQSAAGLGAKASEVLDGLHTRITQHATQAANYSAVKANDLGATAADALKTFQTAGLALLGAHPEGAEYAKSINYGQQNTHAQTFGPTHATPKAHQAAENSAPAEGTKRVGLHEVIQKLLDSVLRIEERVNNGIPTIAVGSMAAGDVPKDALGKSKHWWNRSIKDGAKGLADGVWGGMKGAGKLGNWLVSGGFGFANAVTRGMGSLASTVGQGMLDKARGFKDVYSEETGPRKILLFAQKLKAGEYFDATTGKPVKTWKDIQGAVADSSGIVMTEEQARTAYVREGMGKKALKGLGALGKMAGSFGNFLGGGLLGGLPLSMRLVSKAGSLITKAALGYANGPQDVYVHDKDHPKRLRKALDAKTMRAGGYSSAVDDKPIKSPHDIAGEVYNYKGVTVLDEEEFKAGLYDKDGNPLKHGIGRLLNRATKLLGAGFGAFKWLADGVNKGVGNALGLGKGLLSGFAGLFGHNGLFVGGGKKLMTTVEEIRDLLKDRMPIPHKIRKGSVEDQDLQRKESQEEAWKKASGWQGGEDPKQTKGLAGLLGGLLSRKKKDDEQKDDSKGGIVDDIESGAGQAIGGAILSKIPGGKYLRKIPGIGRLFKGGAVKAVEGAAESAVGGTVKRGLGSKILGGLKMGKGLGAGLALGAGASLANATGHTTIGKGLDVGSDVATGWSLASGAAGLMGVEGGAMGLAGMAGGGLMTGLGALIASPVLLPALGIAAAGGLAYGGYKLLTRNRLDTWSKIRYAQYGWKDSDTSMVSKVFALENALMPGLTFVGGTAQIDPKKVDIKSAIEGLGVDMSNDGDRKSFPVWYLQRFKPVFITHMTVLNSIKPGTKFSDVDKLSPADKKKYLDGIKMPSGVYSNMTSPAIAAGASLTAGPDEVKQAMADAQAEVDKATKDDKDKKPTDKLADPTAKAGLDAAGKPASAVGAAVGAAAAGVIDKINQSAAGPNKGAAVTKPTGQGGGMAAAGATAGAAIKAVSKGRVDAMDAIRFKTYGLKELDADKVNSLRQLESLVQADVKMNKTKAEWGGDVSDLLAKIAPQFGFSGNRSNRAYDWMDWFNKRFLPTYLAYVSAVCSVTDKKDPASAMAAIKPDDLLAAAKLVVSATTTSYGTATSVWHVPVSPWANYDLNAESATTDGNIDILKQAQKSTTLPEQAKVQTKASAANDAKNKSKDASPSTPSMLDNLKSGISNAWDKTKKFVGNAYDGAKDAVVSAGKAVGNAASKVVKGAGDALSSGYQAAKSTVSKIGKTISASAGAIKDALIGAMKTAGMTDPKEQAMFMAQMDHESGGFKSLSENLNYRPSVLMSLFGKHFNGPADAAATAAAGPQAIADKIYGGRMGNQGPDDGWNYRGRGVVQLTGRSNYAKYGKLTGLDLLNNPDLASDPGNAAKIAIAYWKDRVSSAAAKAGDVLSVTKAINGGTVGLADRNAKYQSYLQQAQQGALAGKADPNAKTADAGAATAGATQVASTGAAGGSAAGAPADSSVGGAAAGSSAPGGPATSGGSNGTGSPSGFIKVADQTPGPAPATKATDTSITSVASADSITASPSGVSPDVSPAAASSSFGFTNRSKDLAAQGQYQSDSLNKTLGPVQDVLKQQLDVQKQMRDALLQLVTAVGKGGLAGSANPNAKTPSGTAAPGAAASKNPQSMPTAPVSMSKMV